MSLPYLANDFSSFFTKKIQDIRRKFDEVSESLTFDSQHELSPYSLCEFQPVSQTAISALISALPAKQCSLDPIPTCLLKETLDVTLPKITEIVNLSLSTGVFPSAFKRAVITPLIKKPSLEPLFRNYRPISNLSFLSKIVEKMVASQFVRYLNDHQLDEPFQSAYKASHSTETALLKIQEELLTSLDSGKVVFFTMLDLSSAFDTVDHTLLLQRLSSRFGLSGIVLKWFESYLCNRSQSVQIRNSKSSDNFIKWGVPQGSVLGPLLFTAYISPLGDIIRRHNLNFHLYADDCQIYMSYNPSKPESSPLQALECCIREISVWMLQNKLRINTDKTEFIIFGRASSLNKLPDLSLHVGENKIKPSEFVKNLGIYMDKELNYHRQISSVAKICFYHLRNIRRIRSSLTEKAAKTLINAYFLVFLSF